MGDMNYPYANGIVKAKENRIFDKNQFAKLSRTDKSEFLKALKDMGYAESAAEDSLEGIINAETVNTKKFIDDITPAREFTDLFFFTYDALNIKALYKMKIFGYSHPDILVETGSISKEVLKKAIIEGDYSGLTKEHIKLLNKVNDRVKDLTNPRLVSCNIDNCIFDYIFDKLKFTFNEALLTYFKAFVDFANVITLIRCQRLGWSYEEFRDMFITGGKIKENIFCEAYGLAGDGAVRCFQDYYSEKISRGLKTYFEKRNINSLERYFDSLLIAIMKDYLYDSFSIGPIICYFLKKQAEANNIRVIYSGGDTDSGTLTEY